MANRIFFRVFNVSRIFTIRQTKYVGFLQQLPKRCNSSDSAIQTNSKRKFQEALPSVMSSLMASPRISQVPEVADWINEILKHNLTDGKHSRNLTLYAYEMMEKPENITEENLKLSRVLGWCVEMIQAACCVVDDIMDNSTTRHGLPCWYRMPNVGMGAVNDTFLIYNCVYETLNTYFGESPHFTKLVQIMNETALSLAMGQQMDFKMTHPIKNNYGMFTMERYNTIAHYKTSYITYWLPVHLALTIMNIDEEISASVNDICFMLGRLYQIQDDYLDCYGDQNLTRKDSIDIQEGKFTWLAVTALQNGNENQKELFTKYYGSNEPGHAAVIKQLYDELNIPQIYEKTQNDIYDNIVLNIRGLPSNISPDYFYQLIDSLYKRNRY